MPLDHFAWPTPGDLRIELRIGEPRERGLQLFPEGLRKNTPLPDPIVTPTTKATRGGHDVPVTCDEVVDRGLVEPAMWERVMAVALELFDLGTGIGKDAGLVDVPGQGQPGEHHDRDPFDDLPGQHDAPAIKLVRHVAGWQRQQHRWNELHKSDQA